MINTAAAPAMARISVIFTRVPAGAGVGAVVCTGAPPCVAADVTGAGRVVANDAVVLIAGCGGAEFAAELVGSSSLLCVLTIFPTVSYANFLTGL